MPMLNLTESSELRAMKNLLNRVSFAELPPMPSTEQEVRHTMQFDLSLVT